MKAVIQRVKNASVKVNNTITGSIDNGLLVYIGFDANDLEKNILPFCTKISKLRIFSDENGKMNLSIKDTFNKILLVSQFTLSANVYKGNRPSFDYALDPKIANEYYKLTIKSFVDLNIEVQTGIFGEHMDVSYLNDGPITFILDSDNFLKN